MGRAPDHLYRRPQSAGEPVAKLVGIFGGTLGRRGIGCRNLGYRREYRVCAGPFFNAAQQSIASHRTLYAFEGGKDIAAYGDDRGPPDFPGARSGEKNLALGAAAEDRA